LIKLYDSVKHKSILQFYLNLSATNVWLLDHHQAILTRKIKQFTCSAHYIQCRIGSYKIYTIDKILLQKCNYWVVILHVIYLELLWRD